MIRNKIQWQLWIPIAAGILDLGWAFSALSPAEGANPASSVAMVNSAVWIFLHVPAVMLGGLPFDGGPVTGAMPKAELFLIGALGMAQMAALGWWLGRYLDKKRKA